MKEPRRATKSTKQSSFPPSFPRHWFGSGTGKGSHGLHWYSKLLLKETPPTLIPFAMPEAGRPLDSVLLVEGQVEEKSAQSAGQMRAREKVEIERPLSGQDAVFGVLLSCRLWFIRDWPECENGDGLDSPSAFLHPLLQQFIPECRLTQSFSGERPLNAQCTVHDSCYPTAVGFASIL
jgi:hypothetical protein